MDMSQYGRSKTFITFEDVVDGPMRAKTVDCEIGGYGRPVLELDNGRKSSVNKTNAQVLIDAYGADSRDWIGKTIELYAGQTKYDGGEGDSVLIRPVSPPTSFKERTPVAPKLPPKAADMSDEIPF